MHFRRVSKSKKAKPSDDATTPGTIIAAKIRARANKLTDSGREALMGDAMRIICSSEGDAARAHIAVPAASAEFQRNPCRLPPASGPAFAKMHRV